MKTILTTALLMAALLTYGNEGISLNCYTGGFAYNKLEIKEANQYLDFKTEGIGLKVASANLSENQLLTDVIFSIDRNLCQFSQGNSETEIICNTDRLNIKINYFDFKRQVEEVKEIELQYVSLLLKRVSFDYTGIKLLVLSSNGSDALALSNGFKICQN